MHSILPGKNTLLISANEDIQLAVADNDALLAGIQVYDTPFGGARNTVNIATAATINDNTIAITISVTANQGDQFFVHIAADLLQDAAGNKNTAITSDNELRLHMARDRFIVTNLPRSTNVPVDNHSHHFAFSIESNQALAGEYRLGLKGASSAAPTAAELTDATAAITRTISETAINIYLPFHIDGTYFDNGATQDYATARATILSPETHYILYATSTNVPEGKVWELFYLTTGVLPTNTNPIYGAPPEQITLRANEPFAVPFMMGQLSGLIKSGQIQVFYYITKSRCGEVNPNYDYKIFCDFSDTPSLRILITDRYTDGDTTLTLQDGFKSKTTTIQVQSP